MSPPSETWFDRLSAPHTRRQSLKVAAAGAAAAVGASLPLAGQVTEAEAASAHDCRQGCVWMAGQIYARGQRQNEATYWTSTIFTARALGPLLGPFFSVWVRGKRREFADELWINYRLNKSTCEKPFCPGFDPKRPGGPCDGCNPPLYCNPCDLVPSGYTCCIYEPSDCHGDCCHDSPGCP